MTNILFPIIHKMRCRGGGGCTHLVVVGKDSVANLFIESLQLKMYLDTEKESKRVVFTGGKA